MSTEITRTQKLHQDALKARLRKLRDALGLSNAAIARKTGVCDELVRRRLSVDFDDAYVGGRVLDALERLAADLGPVLGKAAVLDAVVSVITDGECQVTARPAEANATADVHTEIAEADAAKASLRLVTFDALADGHVLPSEQAEIDEAEEVADRAEAEARDAIERFSRSCVAIR